MSWTEARTTEVTRLWNLGFSASQIAKQIGGCSRNAVIGKVYRIGLQARTAAVVAQALAIGGRLPERRYPTPKAPAVKRAPSQNAGLAFRTRKFAVKPVNIPEPTPMDATHAKPWLERQFGQCAAPVSGVGADVWSCCAPCGDDHYCGPHRAVLYVKPATSAKDLTRMAVRAAA